VQAKNPVHTNEAPAIRVQNNGEKKGCEEGTATSLGKKKGRPKAPERRAAKGGEKKRRRLPSRRRTNKGGNQRGRESRAMGSESEVEGK